jgi:hypothetical protein
MSQREQNAVIEIGFALFLSVIAIAVFRNSLSLPTSLREPLGSATLPQVVCAIILFFCAVLVARSIRVLIAERTARSKTAKIDPERQDAISGHQPQPLLAAAIFAYAVLYVALMQSRLVPAYLLTPALLFVSILTLTRFRLASLLPAAVLAVVIGVGVPMIFTDFFQVNLP